MTRFDVIKTYCVRFPKGRYTNRMTMACESICDLFRSCKESHKDHYHGDCFYKFEIETVGKNVERKVK